MPIILAAAAAVCAIVGARLDTSDAHAGVPPLFRHVVVIVFENKRAASVLDSRDAPTFHLLARRYAQLSNYDAVAHPSLPNYLALVSGSTQGVRHDCLHCVVTAPSLADTLSAAGKTWRAYVEGSVPGRPLALPPLDRARVPFLYFDSVLDSSHRLADVVPLRQFDRDLRSTRLPSFSLVVPNLCHSMHTCPVAAGDRWLGRFLRPLLENPSLKRTVVFVVFDESSRRDTAGGGGHVAALAVGPLVRAGARDRLPLDHYDLLRTIEDGLGVPPLGRSEDAPPVCGIWRRETDALRRGYGC